MFRGAFQIMPVFAALGVVGIVVTAAYILWKIVQYVFLGEFEQEKWDDATHHAPLFDVAAFEKVTMWPLVLFMVLFGVYPTPIVDFFNSAAAFLFGG